MASVGWFVGLAPSPRLRAGDAARTQPRQPGQWRHWAPLSSRCCHPDIRRSARQQVRARSFAAGQPSRAATAPTPSDRSSARTGAPAASVQTSGLAHRSSVDRRHRAGSAPGPRFHILDPDRLETRPAPASAITAPAPAAARTGGLAVVGPEDHARRRIVIQAGSFALRHLLAGGLAAQIARRG